MSVVPSLKEPPSPGQMFALLEELFCSLGSATTYVGGTFVFDVVGYGAKRVDLAVPGGRWSEAIDDSCPTDAALIATPFAFALTFMRPDCIPELIELGQLQVEGSAEHFTRLGDLLAQGASPLSLRIRDTAER